MIAPERVAAVVLAAGLSRRFGGDKLLHPLAGIPLAQHVAQQLAALPLLSRVAVCPDLVGARARLFDGCGFEVIANTDPQRGLASSLVLGARQAIKTGADAMLLCLADMPWVETRHLLALLAATVPGEVTATRMGMGGGPPALFSGARLGELLKLSGDRGAKALLATAHLVDAAPGTLRDYDTPEDFAGEDGA